MDHVKGLEDSQASFVSMVMDRLHALEAENTRLQTAVTQLQESIHLIQDMTVFSDGLVFSPGFTKRPDVMFLNQQKMPLDHLHLQATVWYGPMAIHVLVYGRGGREEEVGCVMVGEEGDWDARITIKQLLDAINNECKSGKLDNFFREKHPRFWNGLSSQYAYRAHQRHHFRLNWTYHETRSILM